LHAIRPAYGDLKVLLKYYYLDKIRYILLDIFLWPCTIIGAVMGGWAGYNFAGAGAALFFAFIGGIGGRFIGGTVAQLIFVFIVYWPVTISFIILSLLGAASYNLWDVRF
jgi:hypothetical protein